MAPKARLFLLALASAATAFAAPPPALANALEYLRDQRSYSWEVINGDPGPVAQEFQTRRGTVTTVTQNTTPNLKGRLDRNGDMFITREWADGLQLDSILTADGMVVTRTPEGWLSEREILAAQAEERMRGRGTSPRLQWLRRADRPDIRRPDQELLPFLKSSEPFETHGDTYIVRLRGRAPGEEEGEPTTQVTVAMNVRAGAVRDYEVKIEAMRRATRARIALPVTEQRIVVLSYLPIGRIDIPPEAAEKLAAARASSRPASK